MFCKKSAPRAGGKRCRRAIEVKVHNKLRQQQTTSATTTYNSRRQQTRYPLNKADRRVMIAAYASAVMRECHQVLQPLQLPCANQQRLWWRKIAVRTWEVKSAESLYKGGWLTDKLSSRNPPSCRFLLPYLQVT